MGKSFWNLQNNTKLLSRCILIAGVLIACMMGWNSYKASFLQNDYEIPRKSAGEGSFEQELIVSVEGGEKNSLTVTIEEQLLSEEEAVAELEKAEKVLRELIKGENESLLAIETDMNLVQQVPGTLVEAEWTVYPSEYLNSEGSFREEIEILEPVEVLLSAILTCQNLSRDFEITVQLLPRSLSERKVFQKLAEDAQKNSKETVVLPKEYEGKRILWKKPLDTTFLLVLGICVAAAVSLNLGEKRDRRAECKRRREELERDYAQMVSKFAMLLSAGLSVRNAWERIVRLNQKKSEKNKILDMEMSRSFRDLQKGIPELEVYEDFGKRIGEIHYKKLMALFIADRKRGTVPLLETMNQEMLLAWEEQKRKTRQQGEKIGTKLLLPMMGMLLVVFLMVLVPAFLSFKI